MAVDGSDSNPGTVTQPVATLEKAQSLVRECKLNRGLPQGGIKVTLRGGHYLRDRTFKLTSLDSGAAGAPVTFQAYPGEEVRLIGGLELDPKWFSPVVDSSPVWGRLDDLAKGHVMQVDLAAQGITDYGLLNPGTGVGGNDPPLELSFNGEMMQLARWPNSDFRLTATAPSNHEFGYKGDRPQRWTKAPDPWVFGYWHWNFMDDYVSVADIDTARKLIILTSDPPAGYGIIAGQRWYALNLLEEIDAPGEWYLDRSGGVLYFWPPADLETGTTLLSTLKSPLIELREASHITLRGIIFEVGRAGGVVVTGGNNNVISQCTIRHFGQHGVTVTGRNSGVQDCKIYNVECGVVLSGGDRAKLTAANLFVDNSHIYNFGRWNRTYVPAVSILGCGNRISHNLIHDGPHSAITHYGNNHLMEYNIIHDVVTETTDAGAIYSGRHWDYQGNIIRHNFFHHIRNKVNNDTHAVYLDDMLSGHIVFGNMFYEIGGSGIFNNGGRDNLLENNVFARCNRAHLGTRRGADWITCTPGSVWHDRFLGALKAFDYRHPPWSTAYPRLLAIPDDCASPEFAEFKNPGGCRFVRNIGWQNNRFLYEGHTGVGAFRYYTIENNIDNQDPLFYDEANRVLALRESSPAYDMAGFERIPFERIGRFHRNKASRPLPPDGYVNVDEDTFYWAPALPAHSRDVYLGTDSTLVAKADPTCEEFKDRLSEAKYAPAALQPLTTYYWRIDERGPEGSVLAKGDLWRFTTGSTIAKHPRPTDGAVSVHPQAVALKWKKGVGAVSHDVYLDTDTLLKVGSFQASSADATYQAGTLEPDTTYYWRVDEKGPTGRILAKGDVWSFTTTGKKARKPNPSDGRQDVAFLRPRLSWKSGAYAVSHEVYLDTERSLTAEHLMATQTATTYRPGPLQPETTYYWRIDQVDDALGKTLGDVWQFTTYPKAKLVSWWRQGAADSPANREELDNNVITEGAPWLRQVDSAQGYESGKIHGEVTVAAYDGPSHVGAVLEASRWAARFNSGAVTLSETASEKAAHNFPGPFSIFFRLRLLSETAGGMLASNQIKHNRKGNAEIILSAESGIYMRLKDTVDDFCWASLKPDVPVGTWFDLVCVYNGDSTDPIDFYIDGQTQPPTESACSHLGVLRSHHNAWAIGARSGGYLDQLQDTEIESVAFFQGVLTDSQLRALSFP